MLYLSKLNRVQQKTIKYSSYIPTAMTRTKVTNSSDSIDLRLWHVLNLIIKFIFCLVFNFLYLIYWAKLIKQLERKWNRDSKFFLKCAITKHLRKTQNIFGNHLLSLFSAIYFYNFKCVRVKSYQRYLPCFKWIQSISLVSRTSFSTSDAWLKKEPVIEVVTLYD